jgi:hypothetical protein
MKSDDGASIKYIKTMIQVEFIATINQAAADLNGVNSIDAYMDLVKTELQRPRRELIYNYRGFGIVVQSITDDLVYGPYPTVLEWEPIASNKSVRVVWQVELATLACAPITTFTSIDNPNRYQILQLVEDSGLSFDEDGAVSVQTNGTLEVAVPPTGFTNSLNRENLKNFAKWFFPNQLLNFHRTIDINVRKDHRTVDYRITDTEIKTDNPLYPYMVSMNGKHSIQSNLLGNDWTQGMGFRTWLNDLNCSFKVRPGVWKGWAWIAFLHIMEQRRSRSNSTNFGSAPKALDEWISPTDGAEQPNGAKDADDRDFEAKQTPLFLKIEEDLFGREVSINSRWVITCSLMDLFRSTGMFYPVHTKWDGKAITEVPDVIRDTNKSVKEQWVQWKQTMPGQNAQGTRGIGLPSFNLVFDPCDSDKNREQLIYSNAHTGSPFDSSGYFDQDNYLHQDSPSDPGWSVTENEDGERPPLGHGNYDSVFNSGAASSYLSGVDPENSWIDYKNEFELIEESNTTYIPELNIYGLDGVRTRMNNGVNNTEHSRKDQTGFRINSARIGTNQSLANGKWDNDLIQQAGHPLYKIVMRGSALRLGFQIPTPALTRVSRVSTDSNQEDSLYPVYRVGQQRWKHKLLNISDQVPVYLAMWEITYGLASPIEGDDIRFISSGRPAQFS